MSTTNPNPFGTEPAPVATPATSSAGSQTPARPEPQGYSAVALIIAALLGLVLGVSGAMFVDYHITPPPTALAAQSGTGTTLSAPTTCPTGDKVYQARINGDEGEEVKDGKLVPGSERVLVKAKYDSFGRASDVTVKVAALAGGDKPVIDSIHAWTPQAAKPGDALKHTIIRYAVQRNADETVLEQTKTVHGKDTTVFVCVDAKKENP